MSRHNKRSLFQRWSDGLFEFLGRLRDTWCIADPYRFGTKYQTVVIPELGTINRNGRIYTREIAEKMCGQFDPERTGGELGHPDSSIVSLSNVSHRIHRVFVSDNALWVEYSVLDNAAGRLLYDLFQKIGPEGFVLSPRGVGSIRNGYPQEDYKVITYDFIPISESAFRPFTEEEVIAAGMKLFPMESAWTKWYNTPNDDFGEVTPRSLVEDGSTAKVMTTIEQMQQGVYA